MVHRSKALLYLAPVLALVETPHLEYLVIERGTLKVERVAPGGVAVIHVHVLYHLQTLTQLLKLAGGDGENHLVLARAGALDHVSRRLAERADEVAALITAESGKPLKWARLEVARAVSTFRWGAEEARRWSGTLQRLDTDPAATGRMALVRRVPRGPVLGIAPFNFPLNLVAHKVAPAIAARHTAVFSRARSASLLPGGGT